VGPLHRIKFYRIVLDEAHHIKNHACKTSIAVRALTGNFKWCITGTPILNFVEELYPYFAFLKVPHTGNYETFCHNYANNRKSCREPVQVERIRNILQAIMLRRTHVNTLFGSPIVKLPGISHKTVLVEFNPVERNIYNMIKTRYVQQINSYSRSGSLFSNYSKILGMLLRLRMLCSHVLLIQDVLKGMFTAADVEALWRLTAKEVQASDDSAQQNMIKTLRKMLAKNENTLQTSQTLGPAVTPATTLEVQDENNMETGSTYGLYFKFRKFLRMLSESDTWAELHLRSTCAKCRSPPDDPVCTSCFHVYCQECIMQLDEERKLAGEEKMTCLECQTRFEETTPCRGLEALGFGSAAVMPNVAKKQKKIAKQLKRAEKAARGRRSTSARRSGTVDEADDDEDEEEYVDWIEEGRGSLPSAKLAATKAAILNWREAYPKEKIIVYTQFLDLGRLLSQVCVAEGWGHIHFNGKMSIEARAKAIDTFKDDPDIFIMICSLKAGGVGLNLTMASKVIILDLWFNSAIESQAYCRVFRIGQEQPVDVLRFVVKDTIDEELINMQDRKDVEVQATIGPDSLGKRATIQQLLGLFGEVKEGDEGQNEFILVEEDSEDGEDEYVDPATRLPPRPF
jgi:SNF2 family DNA or RNA helicase